MNVSELLLVGGGSCLGGMGRYCVSGLVMQHTGAGRFPWGTIVVNTIGCLLIGLIAGVAEHQHIISPQLRLFLITGILGGFTTFSAFGYETIFLLRTGNTTFAFANVALSLLLCLPAVWLGGKMGVASP